MLYFVKHKVDRDIDARKLIRFSNGGITPKRLEKTTLMNFLYEIYLANRIIEEENKEIDKATNGRV